MNRRCAWAGVAGAVLSLALTGGCGGGAAPSRDRVVVAVLPFLSYAPLFIAADEGLFAAQGLEVELVEIGTTEATAALVRGDADAVSNYLTTGLFNTIHRGARLRVVADKGHEDPGGCVANGLLVRRELVADAGRFDLRLLKGRRIDLRSGQLEEYWVDRLLGRHGLLLADVDVCVVPQQAKLNALRSGGVEALVWSEPYVTQAVEAGVGVPVARPTDALPVLQWSFLIYGRSLLDDRPEVGERLMIAYLQGVDRYVNGDRRRNAAFVAAHTGLSPDLVERACWLPIRTDGAIDAASVTDFQRWAVERGYQDAVVPVEEFWEPRFVERARAGRPAGTADPS